MNPANIKNLTFNENTYSKEIKDYLVQEWIRNVISTVRMLVILRQSIYSLGYTFPVQSSKKRTNYSFYELDHRTGTIFLTLMLSYFHL